MNQYTIQSVNINKGKKKSLTGTVLEVGGEFGGEIPTNFIAYTHEIAGKSFLYFKNAESEQSPFYYVNYRVDGDKLFTREVRAESLEGAKLDTWADVRFEFTSRIKKHATDFLDTEVIWEKQ